MTVYLDMKKLFLLLITGFLNPTYAASCGAAGVILKDNFGHLARITGSYDCWEKANKGGECFSIEQVSRNERLTGFRSHRVVYRDKEYAFVESWRRGAPAYVTGAFYWSSEDVKKFRKVNFGFAGGTDEETHFHFDSKLQPPFESLEFPPPELDGKQFAYVGCVRN